MKNCGNMLDGFAEWVASKPADESYNYISDSDCALAQFLKSKHPESFVSVGPRDFAINEYGNCYSYPYAINECVREEPRTFGALHERLAKI